MPSVWVISLCVAIVAAVVVVLMRGGSGAESFEVPDTPLSQALDRTLAAGGPYIAVAHFEPAGMAPVDHRYEGVTTPGTEMVAITDQRAVLSNLDAIDDYEVVGPETISGASTTHYSATVDPTLQEALTDERVEAHDVNATVVPPITEVQDRAPEIDVWIDDAGRIRRFHVSESYGDGELAASTTIDFPAR